MGPPTWEPTASSGCPCCAPEPEVPGTAPRESRPSTPFINRRIGSPLYVRASSTHSAMATRAGVAECSTSPMATRSNARSIRASWTTGYWGARRSIVASIRSRRRTTIATRSRANDAAVGSSSVSARCRSRIAGAVRCPNSASNSAASASRRAARRERISSAWPPVAAGAEFPPRPVPPSRLAPS